jgi:hypothetical protein
VNKQSQLAGANRAKQTQSGATRVVSAGQFCGAKPIPAIMPIRRSAFPGGRIMPNKATLGQDGVSGWTPEGRIVRNEANLGQRTWHPEANYAKRT